MSDSSASIGLAAAALALLGVPLYKYLTKEPPPLVRNGPADYADIVEDIDAFWRENFAEQFPELSSSYVSPSVSFAAQVRVIDEPDWELAGTYTDDDMRIRIALSDDESEVTHTIAHEFGHHIQHLSGLGADFRRMAAFSFNGREAEGSVLYELQAECLAGVWAADAVARGRRNARRQVQGHQLREAMSEDSSTHGSSQERVAWYQRGFDSGRASDCVAATP